MLDLNPDGHRWVIDPTTPSTDCGHGRCYGPGGRRSRTVELQRIKTRTDSCGWKKEIIKATSMWRPVRFIVHKNVWMKSSNNSFIPVSRGRHKKLNAGHRGQSDLGSNGRNRSAEEFVERIGLGHLKRTAWLSPRPAEEHFSVKLLELAKLLNVICGCETLQMKRNGVLSGSNQYWTRRESCTIKQFNKRNSIGYVVK